MAIINSDFSERYAKICDALYDLELNDLEARLAPGSDMAFGYVHVDLCKDDEKVGKIIYDREPPQVTFSDASIADKLREYFNSH